MDTSMVGLIKAIALAVPETAAARAEQAAQDAEGYAQQAGSATIGLVYDAANDTVTITTVGG